MDFMQNMIDRAAKVPQRIVFPEGDDETMMRAVAAAAKTGIASPVLVGDARQLRSLAAERDIDLDGIEICDMADEAYLTSVVERFLKLPTCMFGEAILRPTLKDPLYFAMAMVAVGDADAAFAGITATTGDVIMAGQVMIGLAPGIDTPSSVAFFCVDGFEGAEGRLLAFGDSAVCVNPSDEELASIAISCCDSVRDLMDWEPRCALVSHSTCGSADNVLTEKVVSALEIAQGRRPDLAIDGEFQLDAALSPRVAARKVKRESDVAGKANIVIWPDLNVGNIAVKCVQLFAHGRAFGPMLQGFNKIVCDCSRGASVDEIVGNIAISSIRAAALAERTKEA